MTKFRASIGRNEVLTAPITDLLIITPLLVEKIRTHEILRFLKMKNNKSSAAGGFFFEIIRAGCC